MSKENFLSKLLGTKSSGSIKEDEIKEKSVDIITMESTWQDRLKFEHAQLEHRVNSLQKFMHSKEFRSLSRTQKAELKAQYKYMYKYLNVLVRRVRSL